MINDQFKNLSELITETLKLRNLDVKKLSELTDIPLHYLTALINGEFSKLPAVPYIRGYLIRIAEILRINADVLLRAYKQEISLRPSKTSGPEDKLPPNRYALKPLHKKTVIIVGIILIVIATYSIWRINDFLGTPQIKIISPAVDNLIVNSPLIKVSGVINSKDKLTINNEEILAQKNGQFEKEILLQAGINTIEFKVKRFLGKEVRLIRQVIHQP